MSNFLRIAPENIEFRDLSAGESDSVEVFVTNVSRESIKIRFKTSEPIFKLSKITDYLITPGYTVKNVISYTAESEEQIKGFLQIISEKKTHEIPITTYPPLPALSVNTNKIDFGDITLTSNQTKTFSISNYGGTKGSFKVTSTNENVTLTPAQGLLDTNQKENITISFKPPKPGLYEFYLNVTTDYSSSTLRPIKVTANVIDQSIVILYNDTETKAINFGNVFWGQTVEKKIAFKNVCPIRKTFIIYDSQSLPGKPPDEFSYFKPKEKEVVVEGNSVKEVPIVISPPSKEVKDNSETKVSQCSRIEVKGTSIRTEVTFYASFTHLIVSVSPQDYDFKQQKLLTKASQTIKITNEIENPITYSIKEIAGYSFNPQSGTIKEKETKEVTVTFYPLALGPYEESTVITFCNGVMRKRIHFHGESTTIDPNSDYEYVRKPIWETDPKARDIAQFPVTPFSLTLSELERKDEMTKTFREYMNSAASARSQRNEQRKMLKQAKLSATLELSSHGKGFTKKDVLALTTQKVAEWQKKSFETDLGFTYGEGLIPPEPRVLSPTAHFVGEVRSPREDLAQTYRRQRNEMNSKKVKLQPTTKLEIAETQRVLNQQQQLAISPSTETIDFGEIPVFTTEKREFTITNNLTQHIFISLDIADEDFQLTQPTTQVIFPQQSGTFVIAIKSKKAGVIDKSIKYTINGHHEYLLHIRADIRPLELQLSTNDMYFKFSADQTDNVMSQTLTLTNPTNSVAQYRWNGFNDIFTIRPTYGTLQPKATASFEVTYRPQNDPHSEIKAALSVVGGPQQYLKVIGETGNAQLALDSTLADFGLLPIGVEKIVEIMLRNDGQDPGIFSVYPNFTDVLNIEPATGVVEPGEMIPLSICVNCAKEGEFLVPIEVNCCGKKPITFQVKGRAETPNVDIDYQGSLDLGQIFIGNYVSRHITITNNGIMDAYIDFDLTNKPNYKIEYSPKYEGKTDENSIHLVNDSDSEDGSDTSREHAPNECLYQMVIKTGTMIEFDLIFKPVVAGDSSMDLPITSKNIMISSKKSLKVTAEAVTSLVEVSATWLDFGIATLTDPMNPNIKPTVREFTLLNKTRKDIRYRLDVSKLDPAFSVDKVEGEIKFASSTPIFVKFKPTEGNLIECSMILYAIPEEGKELKCAKIELTAVINSTAVTVSHPMLVFPPVPTDTTIERTIFLINTMFIEAHVDAIVPLNEKLFPLTVEFPDGQELKHTTDRLPIKLTFTSPKTISFSTQIALVCSDGNSATFAVSCTADNSICTLENFTMNNEYNLIRNPSKPVQIISKSSTIKDDFLSYVSSLKDIDQYSFDRPAYSQETYDFVTEVLNDCVMTTRISDIATNFSRSDGELLVEMISNLAGNRKPPNLSNTNKPRTESDDSKVAKMKSILTSITQMGGCVSNINPVFLTSKSTFLSVTKRNVIKLLLSGNENERQNERFYNHFINSDQFQSKLQPRMKKYESLYKDISRAAYLYVIMQLLKILFITKGDCEKLNNVPGVSDAYKQVESIPEFPKNTKLLDASNYQSKLEGFILRWVTIHTFKENGPGLVPTVFDDLRNPLFFGFVLKSHIPDLFLPLIDRVVDAEEDRENARAVAEALNSISLGINVTDDMIIHGNPIMLLLLTFQMIQVLPHYIPTTLLTFEAGLNTVVQQSIAIQNPSKVEITYEVQIKGSPNFSTANQLLTIRPNATENCVIQYAARTHVPEHATLSLIPYIKKVSEPKTSRTTAASSRRSLAKSAVSSQRSLMSVSSVRTQQNPPAHASTIIMQMKSDVNVGLPSEVITVKGVLYEHTQLEVDVPNKCQIPGKYKMKYVMAKSADENNQPILSRKMCTDLLQKLFINYSKASSKKSVANVNTVDNFALAAKNHKPFIFSETEFDFDENGAKIPLEFVPISFGEFKCYILFTGPDHVEFIVELVGKTENIPLDPNFMGYQFKAEASTKTEVKIPLDLVNKPLVNAIAYCQVKEESFDIPDAQFQEYLSNRVRDLTTLYTAIVSQIKYLTTCSLNEFDIPFELQLTNFIDSDPVLPVKFVPQKPGKYHATIALMNDYDLRYLTVTGYALAPTKTLDIEMSTTSGKDIVQEFPFYNPSQTVWNFKVDIADSEYFKCDQHFQVKPNSTYMFPLTFRGRQVGEFKTQITITNQNKECTVNYNVIGQVAEPVAEQKIEISLHAHDLKEIPVDLPPFVKFGKIDVTSDIDILQFPKEIDFIDGKPQKKFVITVEPKKSGSYMGSIVFTDRDTQIYCWYMVEVTVEHPEPSSVINIQAVQRERKSFVIPLQNDTDADVTFAVSKYEDELICPSTVTVPKNTRDFPFTVEFQPYTSFAKETFIMFMSDDLGEFIYTLKIEVLKPSIVILAPLIALVGKSSQTFVDLVNPKNTDVHFKIKNPEPDVFIVKNDGDTVVVPAFQTKHVEITYMPATIGIPQSAIITFESSEIGDYIYKLTGVGKPPQPASPHIVETALNTACSGCVIFSNPFHHPVVFSASLSTNDYNAFNLLIGRKREFTLHNYGDTYQISFSFAPKKVLQYVASVVVSTGRSSTAKIGQTENQPQQHIAWKFPIIGLTTSEGGKSLSVLSGVAKKPVNKQISFSLAGETDTFPLSSYQTFFKFDPEFEWVAKYLEAHVDEVKKSEEGYAMLISFKVTVKKQIDCIVQLSIINELMQSWKFPIRITMQPSEVCETIDIMSTINNPTSVPVYLHENFPTKMEFYAYFLPGYSEDLSISAESGVIETCMSGNTRVPLDIIYRPKMYGKYTKGSLMIETNESEYLIAITGKIPEYVPPVVKESSMAASFHSKLPPVRKRRNIIRENIEAAKITKPRSARRKKRPFY